MSKTKSASKAVVLCRDLESLRPRNANQLHRFVELVFGLRVVRQAVVEGNSAPFDYLCAAFFEEPSTGEADAKPQAGRDLIVWANRGGGKTMLGAVATMLDLVYKPGIQIRILGGSMAQSSRMYDYLREMARREIFRGLLAKEPTEREIRLINGSMVRLLAQSSRSVRGEHVHKLRCDEVDDFRDRIWSAAQLATKSGRCGPVHVRGTIEALSTMHLPYGPMSKVMARAAAGDGSRIIRWSAMDVIERCPAQRPCEGCRLWNHCLGRAKHAQGYIGIDDMITLLQRTSDEAWASEMMCLRPRRESMVYRQFDPTPGGRHVMPASPDGDNRVLVGGMDFGMRNPFVMLWARLAPPVDAVADAKRMENWTVEVVDELIEKEMTMDQAAVRMQERGWPRPAWIGVDPAGSQRNRQTGMSDIRFLRNRGYRILAKSARIQEGINVIQRRLDRGTLRIAPTCERLIRDLCEYHYDAEKPHEINPVKDGADHSCDALRYLVMNLEQAGDPVQMRNW